jgi:hypothetical protein
MRLITGIDLASRTVVELALLFQLVSQVLTETMPGSPRRRTAIASLQNISQARRPLPKAVHRLLV